MGLFRPITLFPYPEEELRKIATAANVKNILVVEMSLGQMVEDVEKIVARDKPVSFFGRTGGIVPAPEEIIGEILKLTKTKAKTPKKKTRGK